MTKLMENRRFRKKVAIGQKGKKRLRATSIFKKKEAISSSGLDYYKAMGQDIKQMAYRESEKMRLSTPKWEYVTRLLNQWKYSGTTKRSVGARILLGIFNVNNRAALSSLPPPDHSNIINVVSRPEILLLAYRKVRGNKRAFTKGSG